MKAVCRPNDPDGIERMVSITRLVTHIARALRAAWPAMIGSSSLAAHPLRLARTIIGGEARRRANEKRLGIPIPRFCIISATWRCNLDCLGCYTKSYHPDSQLPTPVIERVIHEANRLGSFIFVIVGGEPLMVPGLIEVLSKFEQALFFMFTNGTLLDRSHVEELRGARSVFPILSLEGEEAVTDERRGRGVGRKVADAMSALRRAGIPFGFSTMVTRRNVRHVTSRPWFDRLWQAGARFGFMIDYVPVPPDGHPHLTLTDEDHIYKADALAKRFYEARPMALNIPPDEYATGECQAAGRGMIHVNADGNVEPCPFCHYAADNVREKPLRDILASPFFAQIRSRLGHLPNPKGGCLLFTHREKVQALAEETGAFRTDRAPAGNQDATGRGRLPGK